MTLGRALMLTLAALLLVSGPAIAQDDEDPLADGEDPFANDTDPFADDTDPFAEYEQAADEVEDASQELESATGDGSGEEDDADTSPQPKPETGGTDDTPAPGLLAVLAIFGLAALAARRLTP